MNARLAIFAIGLAFGAPASVLAQNSTGGAPNPAGTATERRVILRVRYTYVFRSNPAIFENEGPLFGPTHYYLSSEAENWYRTSAEGYWSHATSKHTQNFDPRGRTRRILQDVAYVDSQGSHYSAVQSDTTTGASFLSPTSSESSNRRFGTLIYSHLSRWATYNWQSKFSTFGGGGADESPPPVHIATYSVDPVTGQGSSTGTPVTDFFWTYQMGARNIGGGQTGIGTYETKFNGTGNSSSSKKVYSIPYSTEMFLEDTAKLHPPFPKVTLEPTALGKITDETKAAEIAASFNNYGIYRVFGYLDYPQLQAHAKSWTEKEWREKGPVWVGQKYAENLYSYEGSISKAEYWLESNDCEPFEFTWLEAFRPIQWADTYDLTTGNHEGFPSGDQSGFQLTVRKAMLGKGSQHGVVFKVEPATTSANGDVLLLPVEVLDKDLEAVSKLKVAKMFEAGVLSGPEASSTLSIEKDSDRFYVCIPGAATLGASSIKVATVENPDSSYNDDSTEVDLHIEGNDLISKSMLLVSDDVDDGHQVDGVADDAKNDRTHKIQLGG